MPLSSKEKVLRAAIRVFSKKGYDGASMREIAEAARLTKPMIYYHFKNKKDLYLYLLEIHIEPLHQTLLSQDRTNYNNALCDYNIARAKLEKAVAKELK